MWIYLPPTQPIVIFHRKFFKIKKNILLCCFPVVSDYNHPTDFFNIIDYFFLF